MTAAVAKWVRCESCGVSLKDKNLDEHMQRVHSVKGQQRAKEPGRRVEVAERIWRRTVMIEQELEYGNPRRALRQAERAVRRFPRTPELLYLRGRAEYTLERYHRALATFRKVRKLDPGMRGLKTRIRECERALRVLRGDLGRRLIENLIEEARRAAEEGRRRVSTIIFEELVAEFPEDANLWAVYGESLGKMGDSLGARAALGRSLELDPSDHMAWGALGLVCFEDGDLAGARRCFQGALKAEPRYLQGWYNLAVVAQAEGNLEEAYRLARIAAELNDEYYMAHYLISVVARKLGREREADEALHRASRLNRRYTMRSLLLDLIPGLPFIPRSERSGMEAKEEARLPAEAQEILASVAKAVGRPA
jgi:tetratricopeptide (TPR) repeat protein